MNESGTLFLGLTALLAMVVGFVTFAVLRVGAGVRDAQRQLKTGSGAETTFLTAALQEAVARLKAQEQAMSARAKASEQLSGQIVESLTAGLLISDSDSKIRILNPAAQRLLGFDGTPAGKPVSEVLAAAPLLADAIAECIATGQPILRRSLPMPASSPATHLGVTVSPLGTLGEQAGVICLFSDLTAVYDLEEQLRLKETLARLGELTAGIAHEFRNGLATIHGYGRLLDPEELPARYRPYVEGIRQETEALGNVVTNFLNFARPEQMVLSEVGLEALVRRVADELKHELPSETSIVIEGAFAPVQGDEVLLRQVFANLLRNGAEASHAVGTVPTIRVSSELDLGRNVCRVYVDDNGPGVPVASREKVFRPFFTTRSRGTGLGLAIVQKVMLTHNGKVSIGESPSGGARIQLVFPVAADRPVI